MKCPNCKNKFPSLGNGKESMGKTIYVCPKCSTTFEIHGFQKIFPKGMIVLIVSDFPLGFLPKEVAIPISVIVLVLVLRWAFKPENIRVGMDNVKNT